MPLNPIDGSPDPETLDGTIDADHIRGFEGNDTINAGDSDDLVEGGANDDRLLGEYGDDTVHGDDGDDVIYGGYGNDTLYGGAGNDAFLAFGVDGSDAVYGGDGKDYAYWSSAESGSFDGGRGQDHFAFSGIYLGGPAISVDISTGTATLVQGSQSITLTSVEKLTIYGGSGSDSITGGRFRDQIQVSTGANVVDAGAGNDNVVYSIDAANTLEGGDGIDTLFVGTAFFFSSLVFTVSGGVVDDGFGSSITGFEQFNVYGGAGNDSIHSGDGRDSLFGGRGFDTLDGAGGNDRIFGHGGDDSLFGGDGDDSLSGGRGLDAMTGGAGADVFIFGQSDSLGDVVSDFTSGEDALRIRRDAFGIAAEVTVVILSVDGPVGTDGQFVYNSASGDLVWDADGIGAGGGTVIASLTLAPALLASDIGLV